MAMTARQKTAVKWTAWLGVPAALLAAGTIVVSAVKPVAAKAVAPVAERVTRLEEKEAATEKDIRDIKRGIDRLVCMHMPACRVSPVQEP